jgi:hypothetical protein
MFSVPVWRNCPAPPVARTGSPRRRTGVTLLGLLAVGLALQAAAAPAVTNEAKARLFEAPGTPSADCQIDRLVFPELARLQIKPVLCSDAVFIRRAYLDVIGTLPTAKEARAFIEDASPAKRRALIDQLLERDEFADYWAMKWGDVLRIKAEFPVNLWPNAAQAYHRWVRAAIAANKPYDEFVRELLTSAAATSASAR